MSEDKEPQIPETEAPQEPIVYASPMKRIWAWVGVVYMVIIVLLMTYMFAYGRFLQGIGSLMVCPALGGVAVSLVYSWRSGARRNTGRKVLLGVLLGVCAALFLLGLWNGIPALITNFGA